MNVKLYTKASCSMCLEVKQLLERHGLFYDERRLGDDFTRDELLELFPELLVGEHHFPVIVWDGKRINKDLLGNILTTFKETADRNDF